MHHDEQQQFHSAIMVHDAELRSAPRRKRRVIAFIYFCALSRAASPICYALRTQKRVVHNFGVGALTLSTQAAARS
jgi:hypothetical protein